MECSIVIPAHNEAANLEAYIAHFIQTLPYDVAGVLKEIIIRRKRLKRRYLGCLPAPSAKVSEADPSVCDTARELRRSNQERDVGEPGDTRYHS